jgi:hypothetical protein
VKKKHEGRKAIMKISKEKLIKAAKVIGSIAFEAAILILCNICGDKYKWKKKK